MPRPQSEIWQYFEISENEGGRRKAECKYCGHQQVSGVTRLHQHLLRKCTAIPENIRAELLQKEEARANIPNTAMAAAARYSRQSPRPPPSYAATTSNGHLAYSATISTLHGLSSTPPRDTPIMYTTNENGDDLDAPQPRTQSVLDYHLARALFSADIPMKVVENPYMADFLRRMRPGYVVPSAQTLHQYLLKEQHWDLIAWKKGDSQPSSDPPAHQNSQFMHEHQEPPQEPSQRQRNHHQQLHSNAQQHREQAQAQDRENERDRYQQQQQREQQGIHTTPLPSLLRPPPPPDPPQYSRHSSHQQNITASSSASSSTSSNQPQQQQQQQHQQHQYHHRRSHRHSISNVARPSNISSSASSCSDSSFSHASARIRAPTELDGSL